MFRGTMEVRFLDASLDRLETDARYNAGFADPVVTAFRKRMQFIRAAPDQRDFYNLKSLHFEKLKGEMASDHSMRLNAQWRLILRFEDSPRGKVVLIVKIADYH